MKREDVVANGLFVAFGIFIVLSVWAFDAYKTARRLNAIVDRSDAIAYQVLVQINTMDNALAAIESQAWANERLKIQQANDALYGMGTDFFNPTPVSFGGGNYKTKDDPYWVTRNRTALENYKKEVEAEKAAVHEARRVDDEDLLKEHEGKLSAARTKVANQEQYLKNNGVTL